MVQAQQDLLLVTFTLQRLKVWFLIDGQTDPYLPS